MNEVYVQKTSAGCLRFVKLASLTLPAILSLATASRANAHDGGDCRADWSCSSGFDAQNTENCDPVALRSFRALCEDLKSFDSQKATLESQRDQARAEMGRAQRELSELTASVGQLEQRVSETRLELTRTQDEKRELDAAKRSLETQLEGARSRETALQSESQRLKLERETAAGELEEAQRALTDAAAQTTAAQREARRRLKAAEDNLAKKSEALRAAESTLSKVKESQQSLSTKLEITEGNAKEAQARALLAEQKEKDLKKAEKMSAAAFLSSIALVAVAFIIALATMAFVHRRARRDRALFAVALKKQATRSLNNLDEAAISELARHHALATESRVMLRVALWISVCGALAVALLCGLLLAYDTLGPKESVIWQAIVGIMTPVGALVFVYNTVHSNYVTTMNLCRELGFLEGGLVPSSLPAQPVENASKDLHTPVPVLPSSLPPRAA